MLAHANSKRVGAWHTVICRKREFHGCLSLVHRLFHEKTYHSLHMFSDSVNTGCLSSQIYEDAMCACEDPDAHHCLRAFATCDSKHPCMLHQAHIFDSTLVCLLSHIAGFCCFETNKWLASILISQLSHRVDEICLIPSNQTYFVQASSIETKYSYETQVDCHLVKAFPSYI